MVHQPVFHGLFRRHPEVPVRIRFDLVHRLSGVVGHDLVHGTLHAQHFLGLDLDVLGRAGHVGDGRLVDQNAGIGQGVTFAGPARREEEGAHAGGHAQAVGLHVGLDELHGVVDGEPRGDAAAGTVDVQLDVLFGVFVLEVEQLGDHQVRDGVVDRHADEDDTVLQQQRVDVVGPFPAARLFYHHRH